MDQRGPRPQRARPWQRPSLFSIPGQRNPWATRTQKQPRGSRSSGGRGRGAGPRGATASHWRALRSLRHVTEPARPSCPRPQSWCAAPGARIPRSPETCGSSPASQSPPATSVTPPIFFFKVLTDSRENLGWLHSLQGRHHPSPTGVATHPRALRSQRLGGWKLGRTGLHSNPSITPPIVRPQLDHVFSRFSYLKMYIVIPTTTWSEE